jgi:hypothetical protein
VAKVPRHNTAVQAIALNAILLTVHHRSGAYRSCERGCAA